MQSEDTDIPGNVGLDPEERSRRAEIMFAPFHDRVAAHLDERAKQGRATQIATIHSFTPVFLGVRRPWHAGVLYDQAIEFGQAVLAGLNIGGALNVAANEPYVISRDGDYAIPVHGDDRDIPAVLIEIRRTAGEPRRHRGMGAPPGRSVAGAADKGLVTKLACSSATREPSRL